MCGIGSICVVHTSAAAQVGRRAVTQRKMVASWYHHLTVVTVVLLGSGYSSAFCGWQHARKCRSHGAVVEVSKAVLYFGVCCVSMSCKLLQP